MTYYPPETIFIGNVTLALGDAALLQWVAGAIAQVGGSVQSSPVNLRRPKAKDGYITLPIGCEMMEQANLQKLLYDLEAGMPFLFVDQLVVQAPQSLPSRVTPACGSRTGQWKGTK
ncbi:MAG: hypothetical protein HY244_04035 [Rhizobiales bacterium]|nr:hypothetical protein [Hyphomicrobiales bacterium]